MGVHEIAEMLGVTRQRVNQLVHSSKGFPAPVAELAAGRVWRRSDVEAWTAERAAKRGGGERD